MRVVNRFCSDARGINSNLAVLGAASLTAGYLFLSLTTLQIMDQEREAHYWNSVQMAMGLDNKIEDMIHQYHDGVGDWTNRYTREEIAWMTAIYHKQQITLQTIVDDQLIHASNDPTRTRISESPKKYRFDASTVEVQYIVNEDTDKVISIQYFVNIAGQPDFHNNAPYADGEPFFYIVSHQPDPSVTGGNWVGLQYTDYGQHGTYYKGIFDSSIRPSLLVILPGDPLRTSVPSRPADFESSVGWQDDDDSLASETNPDDWDGPSTDGDWNDT